MKQITTEGIVLSSRKLGEKDKIIILFSPRYGKLTTLAKGIRSVESRRNPLVEIFNINTFYLHKGKSFYIVTDVKSKDCLDSTKLSLKQISALFYISELIELSLRDEEVEHGAYELFKEYRKRIIENNHKINNLVLSFELKLLDLLGFRPELVECVICRKKLTPNNNKFSVKNNGVVCSVCREGMPMSDESIKIKRFMLDSTMKDVLRFNYSSDRNQEIRSCIEEYIEETLEKKPKASKFLAEICHEQNN